MDQLSSATHRLKDKHFSVNKITAEFSCPTNSIAMKSNVAQFFFIMLMFNLLPDKAFKNTIEAIPVIAMST